MPARVWTGAGLLVETYQLRGQPEFLPPFLQIKRDLWGRALEALQGLCLVIETGDLGLQPGNNHQPVCLVIEVRQFEGSPLILDLVKGFNQDP